MELDDMVIGLKRVDDELELLGQAEDGHLRKPIREARIVIEALNGNALRNRITEIMRDQLAGDEERNPAGVPIYGIDEATDMILAEVIKKPSNQAVAGRIVRDCATCSDQPVIPPNCPSCGGRGGFGAYRIAGSIVYACPTVRDNPVQTGALIVAEIDQMSRPASSVTNACSPARGGGALQEVAAERLRQIEGEGWTPEHDDIHVDGELADAAACYAAGRIPQAVYSKAEAIREASGRYGSLWPWDGDAWKPRGRRDNLIRAGALILAEIERLDRINPK